MKIWRYTCRVHGTEAQKLCADNWEPFAVTMSELDGGMLVWFRQQFDIEKEKPINRQIDY